RFRWATVTARPPAALHRLRIRFDGRPSIEVPRERGRRGLPKRTEGADRFVGTCATLAKRYPDHCEFFREPAAADSEDRSALRQHVQRRDFFGHVRRVALREDEDPGAEADRFGD